MVNFTSYHLYSDNNIRMVKRTILAEPNQHRCISLLRTIEVSYHRGIPFILFLPGNIYRGIPFGVGIISHVPPWETSILNCVKKTRLCKIVFRLFQLLPRKSNAPEWVQYHILGKSVVATTKLNLCVSSLLYQMHTLCRYSISMRSHYLSLPQFCFLRRRYNRFPIVVM